MACPHNLATVIYSAVLHIMILLAMLGGDDDICQSHIEASSPSFHVASTCTACLAYVQSCHNTMHAHTVTAQPYGLRDIIP